MKSLSLRHVETTKFLEREQLSWDFSLTTGTLLNMKRGDLWEKEDDLGGLLSDINTRNKGSEQTFHPSALWVPSTSS